MIRYPLAHQYADEMALDEWNEEREVIAATRARLLRQEQNLHALFMSLAPGPHSDIVERELETVREALDASDDINGLVLNRIDDLEAFGDSPT